MKPWSQSSVCIGRHTCHSKTNIISWISQQCMSTCLHHSTSTSFTWTYLDPFFPSMACAATAQQNTVCALRGCDAGRFCWAWALKLQSFCTFVQCMQGYARISVKPVHDATGAQRPSKSKPGTSAPLMAPLISSTSSTSSTANDSKDILFHDPLKSPIEKAIGQTPWFKNHLLKHFRGEAFHRQFHKQECIQPIPTPRTHTGISPQEHTVLRWKVFKMRASCVKHCTSIAAARVIAATIVDKCVHVHSSSKDIPIVHVVHLLDRLTTLLKPLLCMIDMLVNASPRPSSIHYCWSMVSIINPNLQSVIPAIGYPSSAELLWFTRCMGFRGSCAKLWCTSRGKYSQLGAVQFKSFFTEYLRLSNEKKKRWNWWMTSIIALPLESW